MAGGFEKGLNLLNENDCRAQNLITICDKKVLQISLSFFDRIYCSDKTLVVGDSSIYSEETETKYAKTISEETFNYAKTVQNIFTRKKIRNSKLKIPTRKKNTLCD